MLDENQCSCIGMCTRGQCVVAEGRKYAPAAESWGRLLAAGGGIAAGEGGQGQQQVVAGQQEEGADKGLGHVGAMLPGRYDLLLHISCACSNCLTLQDIPRCAGV